MSYNNFISRKIRKEFVKFLEKPVTADEKSIQFTISECLREMNAPEHTHTHGYLAPQAKISSPILKKNNLSADKIHQMRSLLRNALLGAFFDEAHIKINIDRSDAKVYGVMTFLIGQSRKVFGYIFHLIRSNERWLISEIEWYKF